MNHQACGNLFQTLPDGLSEELVDVIAEHRFVRIERIVSTGHTTAEGQWYDQDEHEWVVVLRGAARIQFEDSREPVEMTAGDHVNIPAHRKHRVEWTTENEPTVWLAVFYKDPR